MAISTELDHAKLDELFLDPMNPRLGRNSARPDLPQNKVLELMQDWTLDELAVSFLEGGGFWTHEALLVIKEELYGQDRLVVLEGNRRLAALKLLDKAIKGHPVSPKWAEIVRSKKAPPDLFTNIPYFSVDSRQDVEAFLGFRHVTGIKEWRPAEKAQFIAKLIDERHFTYEQVMRRIGSKTPIVRQNYISYRLLLQIEDIAKFPKENLEDRFSVMFLSLRTQGAQAYLQIDIFAEPKKAKMPVPRTHLKALANFARWLFGDEKQPPLFTDSRQVDNFGGILESSKAREYLERNEKPAFEVAYQLAGGDEPELVRLVEQAADNVELALSRVHLHKQSRKLRSAVKRLGADTKQLLHVFPDVEKELNEA